MPDLSLDVVLSEQLAPAPLPFDVVLCEPQSTENDVLITIDTTFSIVASIDLTIGDAPSVEIGAIDAVIGINASVELTATVFVVGIGIDAVLPINLQIEIVATYDSNVFRGAQLDVSSKIECSKLQGINKQGQFESNKKLTHDVGADWQQSKLISVDSQAQLESNIKLQTSDQVLFESAKRISTSSLYSLS